MFSGGPYRCSASKPRSLNDGTAVPHHQRATATPAIGIHRGGKLGTLKRRALGGLDGAGHANIRRCDHYIASGIDAPADHHRAVGRDRCAACEHAGHQCIINFAGSNQSVDDILRGGDHFHAAGIDGTGSADRHALGTDEGDIAANPSALHRIHGALNICSAVDDVHQLRGGTRNDQIDDIAQADNEAAEGAEGIAVTDRAGRDIGGVAAHEDAHGALPIGDNIIAG